MGVMKSLLSEDGSISSMRIMSIISLVTGAVIAMVGLLRGESLSGLALLTGVFVGAAFGGKAAQKAFEK